MPATVDDCYQVFSMNCSKPVTAIHPLSDWLKKQGSLSLQAFRAVVASETARGRLFRTGMVSHANETQAYYVCPHCGLVFIAEAPDKCPVDDTPGASLRG